MNDNRYPLDQESPWIFRIRLTILAGFSFFATMVIAWVVRLIYVSYLLKDVFSASIGIALIAIPVFLFLLSVFYYVFWGLQTGKIDDH